MIFDEIVKFALSILMIIGGYQFYFWSQRRTRLRARSFSFRLENAIRLRPAWVWIYSGLYYPAILAAVISAPNLRYFNYMAFSYCVLLAVHMMVFFIFPVEVPSHWRQQVSSVPSQSERFLLFIQSLDDKSNCFPSMHVSVATLTALHIVRNVPSATTVAVMFVALIAMSCVFTKQHYLMDIPVALVLGWSCFGVFLRLL